MNPKLEIFLLDFTLQLLRQLGSYIKLKKRLKLYYLWFLLVTMPAIECEIYILT